MKGVIINVYNKDYPWILFLHGWEQDKSSLLSIEKETQVFANSVLIDLPGFGELSPLDRPYDIEEYLLYIKQLMKSLEIMPSLIIGHSFGGKLATYYSSQVQEIPLLLLAPSIIPPAISNKNKVMKKIKPFFLFLKRHKMIKSLPSFYLGSRDYQNSKGYLKGTFVRMVHRYPYKSLKDINAPIVIYISEDDHEIPVSRFACLKTINPNIQIHTTKGNHFAFRRYYEEISLKAYELVENCSWK